MPAPKWHLDGHRRGLSTEEAIAYLGTKRRTFNKLKPYLTPIPLGTSRVYDIRDLDRLFDLLKTSGGADDHFNLGPMASECSQDRRPVSEEGESKWVVNQASIRTPMESGELTASTAVNAFRAVSTRIRKQKAG